MLLFQKLTLPLIFNNTINVIYWIDVFINCFVHRMSFDVFVILLTQVMAVLEASCTAGCVTSLANGIATPCPKRIYVFKLQRRAFSDKSSPSK